MRKEFDYPFTITDHMEREFSVADLSVRVTIEADESVALTDWYVSDVEIYGSRPGKRDEWFSVCASAPLFSKIAHYAATYHTDDLNDLWTKWLRDEHPKLARDIFSNDEIRSQ